MCEVVLVFYLKTITNMPNAKSKMALVHNEGRAFVIHHHRIHKFVIRLKISYIPVRLSPSKTLIRIIIQILHDLDNIVVIIIIA
jgi:hypothetical protein